MKNRFLILLLLPFLFPAEEAQSYPSREPPIIETRMWSPEDIEEYFQELKSQEIEKGSEYWKAQESSLVKAGKWVDKIETSQGRGWFVDWLNDLVPTSSAPHSVVMRNVAYHYLKTWPNSREKIANYAWGSVGGQATYGKHFLKSFYQIYSGQRRRLKSQVFDHNNRRLFGQLYDQWVMDWGPDPTDLSGKTVPDGDIPEEFDGKWYLCVKLETESFRYYALMVKTGHIFGIWNNSNTVIKSHLFSKDKTVQSLYPVNIYFFLGDLQRAQAINFTDLYLGLHEKFVNGYWVDIEPRPYRGPTGPSPHVMYEFEYPLYDKAQDTFLPAKATLSSAPSRDYNEVKNIIESLESKGIEIGEHFRNEAGKYKMPD